LRGILSRESQRCHGTEVPAELAPAVDVRRRHIVGGEVERGQDAQKLVLSRHGWLIPAKRFCIALPLVEEAGAQLDAASCASGVQHCVPSAFLPLHSNAHHPSLALHLEALEEPRRLQRPIPSKSDVIRALVLDALKRAKSPHRDVAKPRGFK
jgi:hypothetical protein